MVQMFVYDYDAIHGFVNYGVMGEEDNGGYAAKMRCKKCGAAWLDINYIDGYDACPKCGARGKKYVMPIR